MTPRPRVLAQSEIREMMDYARDMAPLAPIGHPPAVLRLAELAARASLGITPEEAFELAPVLLDFGVLGYRHRGEEPLLRVPHPSGSVLVAKCELLEMLAKGGDS